MVHSQYGAMPYNLSAMTGQSDIFLNFTNAFYNITLPSPIETSNILLFAAAINGTNYLGGFRNISLTYGTAAVTYNFTMYGLLGSAGNLTINNINGPSVVVPTKKQTFNIVNITNKSLTSTSAHIETIVDYSDYGAIPFTWMTDVQQSQSTANFEIPLLNATGIKEMNVYASGGPGGSDTGQYAPKRVSTTTAAQITANPNITVKTFNPEAIDTTLSTSSISIALYISNSSCDIPNPVSSCLLTASSTMATFNPMRAVMGGGKISFRMGYGGILVHYVNVDMMASGPPDALFDSAPATTGTTSSSFAAAQRFGSQGPTVYDYVIVSIPYSETAGSGLDDSAAVSISVPLMYDDNWNVIWNTALNGTNMTSLAANYSHYSTYSADWGNLTTSRTCATANVTFSSQINSTNPCFIDNSSNRIWVRLPHFSGTGPSVSGSTVASAAAAGSSSSGGSASYDLTVSNSEIEKGATKYLGATARFKLNLLNETHYLTLNSVNSTLKTASITVSSAPQTFTLSENETKKVNLNADNYYDIEVRLVKVISTAGANLYLKKINESIPVSSTTPETTQTPSETATTPESEPEVEIKASSQIWVIVLVIVIVVVVIAAFLIYKRKRYSKRGY
jgi:hypothetical protein